jgi:MoaA/NifB/PqqE/SkfB family radical SAM enzyme
MPHDGWREGLRSWADRMAPFRLDWIQVEVSAVCQGGCLYCPVSLLSWHRGDGLMTMATFERLEPWFPSTDLVFLQGWGEPLLHPRFWEMASRVRTAGARVGSTTNGVLLDGANRAALLDSGVELLGVSLAGASSHTHDHFRPGSPLEVLEANLGRLNVERKASGTGLPNLHLAYLLMDGNLRELPLVVDVAERWGASQIVVSHLSLVLSGDLEEQALLARPREWPRVQAVLHETRKRAEERDISFHAYGPGVGGANEAKRGAGALARTDGALGCDSAAGSGVDLGPEPACTENVLGSCFVSARGDVSPCVMANLGWEAAECAPGTTVVPEPARGCNRRPIPGSASGSVHTHWFRGREVPLERLVLGNVGNRSLKEIWQSEPAREFREVYRQRLSGRQGGILPAPCRHCYKLLQA